MSSSLLASSSTPSSWRDYFFSTRWKGKEYLLSPFLDFLLVGGGALIVFLVLLICVPASDQRRAREVSMVIYWGAFICNYPHFMISYQLLYAGYGMKIRRFAQHRTMWWRYINAGVFVPVLLLLLLILMAYDSIYHHSYRWLGYGANVMFFFVGWHYMKQAFGMFVMLSALRKIYFSVWQRRILLWNSYAVWFFAWGFPHPGQSTTTSVALLNNVQKAVLIPVAPIMLPSWLSYSLLSVALFASGAVVMILWNLWFKEHKRPPLAAMLGYLSMYYLFAFIFWMHPLWIMIAPFFHSLQYLLFVIAYQRGHARKELHDMNLKADPQTLQRNSKSVSGRYERFYAYAFLLGLGGFILVPLFIDMYSAHLQLHLAAGFFMTAFSMFINIHHYFIDNVIWRKENSDVGEYLFNWSR